MAKKGKTPSLIGGGAGASTFYVLKRASECGRCDTAIPKGANTVRVSKPGTMGYRAYCLSCFGEVLERTQKDLDRLLVALTAAS